MDFGIRFTYDASVPKSFGQSDPLLEKFVYQAFGPEDPQMLEIRTRCAAAGLPEIQMGALDALHVQVIARACGARLAVEIGTLGGYSGVALLRGLPADGFLHTFELDERHARVARETFEKNELAGRVKVHVGPALERLREIEDQGPFDLVLIDADKAGYSAYLDWAADNLRLGGVVLCDNAFLFGHITDEPQGHMADEIISMRQVFATLAPGGRFQSTLLPTGEGLALGVKVR